MKLGFTGTREGATEEQGVALALILFNLRDEITEGHHGACVGADEQFTMSLVDLAIMRPEIRIVAHPPSQKKLISKLSLVNSHEILEPKEYIKRNHDIVDAVEAVIVTPKTEIEEWRSGTWTTYRYACRTKKKIYLIYPSGWVAEEG